MLTSAIQFQRSKEQRFESMLKALLYVCLLFSAAFAQAETRCSPDGQQLFAQELGYLVAEIRDRYETRSGIESDDQNDAIVFQPHIIYTPAYKEASVYSLTFATAYSYRADTIRAPPSA